MGWTCRPVRRGWDKSKPRRGTAAPAAARPRGGPHASPREQRGSAWSQPLRVPPAPRTRAAQRGGRGAGDATGSRPRGADKAREGKVTLSVTPQHPRPPSPLRRARDSPPRAAARPRPP